MFVVIAFLSIITSENSDQVIVENFKTYILVELLLNLNIVNSYEILVNIYVILFIYKYIYISYDLRMPDKSTALNFCHYQLTYKLMISLEKG